MMFAMLSFFLIIYDNKSSENKPNAFNFLHISVIAHAHRLAWPRALSFGRQHSGRPKKSRVCTKPELNCALELI
jgi:hypothetical protein